MAQAVGRQPVDGLADLAGVRAAAASGGALEAVQGPAVRGEGQGHRRPLPRPARAGAGVVRGREVPDPSARPLRADVADAARHAGAGDATTTSATAPQACSPRSNITTGKVIGSASLPPSRDRVQEVPADDRPGGARRARRAPDPRQLLNPQDAGDPTLAGCTPALSPALHPDRRVLDEPRRALVCRAHRAQAAPRRPPLRRASSTPTSAPGSTTGTRTPSPYVWTKTADADPRNARRILRTNH